MKVGQSAAAMLLRVLILSVALLLAMPLALAQVDPGEGFNYRIELSCPGQGTSCPIRAVDGQDAMGDPTLAVDPFRPQNLIIASLHGGGDNPNAPSPKSRSGQAFTTFTSTNGGASWWDNPFTPPAGVRSNGMAYGENPALAISPYGQAFVGSLYSLPRASNDASAGFDYVLAAQKFRSLQSINDNQDGDYNAQFLTTYYPGNSIQQTWYVYNPHTDNMTVVWHEEVTPHSTGGSDRLPLAADTLGEAQAALRTDQAAKPVLDALPSPRAAQQEGGASSIIGVAWTDLTARGKYHFVERDQAIGPCEASTNPVIKEGYLYIGCKVGPGTFRWNPSAQAGDIEMFRMHPDGGTPEYIGPSPLSGGAPKIGVRSDGRVALMTVDMDEAGGLVLDAVYGGLDTTTGFIKWSQVVDYAPKIPSIPGYNVVDANIQDMIYREYSGVIHMILKRNIERSLQAGEISQPFEPTIHKSIVALDEKHGFLAYHGLDIGNIVNRTMDATLMQQTDAVFNDISDDFLELPPMPHRHNGKTLGDQYQREFFAVGDYGIVIFAELVEVTDLRGPLVPIVSLPPPPAPAPAPAAVSTTTVAGALSASGVTAFAAARMHRKALVGAKKKR